MKLLEFLSRIKFKNDRTLLVAIGIVVIGTFVLIGIGRISWEVGIAFLTGSLAVPTAIGRDDDEDDPPTAGGATPLLVLIFALAVTSCGSSASRAEARGAVLATAEAVKVGDEACAKLALERVDLALAKRCEAAYTSARASLLVAASSVDAWDEGKRGAVVCAVVRAAAEVRQTAVELRSRKLAVPGVIDDASRLAEGLGGCHE